MSVRLGLITLAVGASGVALPRVIQGGMGARISSWSLARAVASTGNLGITSGVAMDVIMARELQDGDPKGIWRRALATFPDQDMVGRIMDKFYIEGGKSQDKPFKPIPMWTITPQQALLEMTVVANYCEIWLAKHNDDSTPTNKGFVGINCLTKIQLPNVPSLYGAMVRIPRRDHTHTHTTSARARAHRPPPQGKRARTDTRSYACVRHCLPRAIQLAECDYVISTRPPHTAPPLGARPRCLWRLVHTPRAPRVAQR